MIPSAYVVETAGLTKRFGSRKVVCDVELRVPRGSAFGYLGPNGAGKTTLIRMLLGLTPATAGSMRLLGLPVPERRSEALARVGAIVEEPRFHGYLTGRENLEIVAAARGHAAARRIGLLRLASPLEQRVVTRGPNQARVRDVVGPDAAVFAAVVADGVAHEPSVDELLAYRETKGRPLDEVMPDWVKRSRGLLDAADPDDLVTVVDVCW